jgi:hypothetical protein
VLIGSFDELAAFEVGPGADEGGEVRRVHGAPAVCADSMSLNAIARPAALTPLPRAGVWRIDEDPSRA